MLRTTTFTTRPSVIPTSTPQPANDCITKPLVAAHGNRLFTESATVRYSTPISATWQMEVSNVTTALVPATGDKPDGTRFMMKPIYIALADGENCLDSDSLARKCDRAMGKMFGETLRAAHVVQMGAGTPAQPAN
ncbi:hypothetical protein [Burkholderia lata]|uniref:hypothetical protein n=1 Tax=Burkholderia lata (strain ATCC 17760 / DSM 23089 / LMG 22485 / NCIMB 9086 / R18194 / 383) TaxID=482957 RepID=UPI0014545707|nr:hypothetical protein [Burkholderia lata]VWM16680.1 hypothetical protein BLA6992_06106 [Burkholderia lata]